MFKQIIFPVQAWLLSQGRCPGCGRPLIEAKIKERKNGIKKLSCECGRDFVFSKKEQRFLRASWGS